MSLASERSRPSFRIGRGHSNVHTTLNVYTQPMQGSLRVAVTKVSDQLFSNCSVAEKWKVVTH